jgi:hypothetical protein
MSEAAWCGVGILLSGLYILFLISLFGKNRRKK